MKFSIATAWIDPSELPAIAREADRLGYDSIAVSDHVVNIEELRTPYPYSADGERRWKSFDPWVDPMVAIGALGAVTERIRFFTNVYVLPMRDPFTTAKTVATASIFTGGRVSLGIGMGWCEDEFDLIGQQFRRRGARSDEMLELLATLWQGGWVEHHGEFGESPLFLYFQGARDPMNPTGLARFVLRPPPSDFDLAETLFRGRPKV